ncbi:hypothetical protein F3J44_09710 [Pantoea sp. Tr-811]|uniref:hypothetical protein n=1 Tax=Pantoea sp. Tr-811 TaxID=2608361 RepID=UPI00141EA8DD|nr:hypothetical protein [Pantoea sp. Tr-811]NIF26662.1 hypothetical protein [Pantoea sp. Tr-811]
MSEYLFSPRDTFLARCWWQGAGARIEAAAWAEAQPHLAAIWVETGSRKARGHWDRYLQSEKNGVLEKHLTPDIYVSPEQRYYELFWFGAYTQGSVAPDKRRYYEIRPADRVGSVYRWVLDSSLDALSGNVGIWETEEAQGVLRKPQSARLWTIDGLGRPLSRGDRPCNLRLITPSGYALKRFESHGERFFSSRKGEEGFVAMEILSIPHHFGEV